MRDTLLFDLDGTLVDTAPDLVRITNAVIAEDARPPIPLDELRSYVGLGARHLLRRAYKAEVGDDRLEEMFHTFLALYADGVAELSQPFPGVLDTLANLQRAGHELHVCTNKPGDLARQLLEALGMSAFFGRVVGADDLPRNKPHSDHVFASAGHRERHRIVLVGDSATDTLAARNARVPSILVTYGYSPEPLDTLKATRTVRSFREVEAVVGEL